MNTKRQDEIRPLTLLMLDCWQREYDKRPYRNFRIKRLDLEERLERPFREIVDFAVIIRFIQTRSLCSVSLVAIPIPRNNDLMYIFASSLKLIQRIELKLLDLPAEFFEYMVLNVDNLYVKELLLEGTHLEDRGVTALRSLLIESQTLLYISVASCSVNQYNFALLADGIHKSTSLRAYTCNRLLGKYLTLDTSKIAAIVASLILQNKLEKIEMQHCEFLSFDASLIAANMTKNTSKLRELNLANNLMGPDGAEHLFRAIVCSRTVTHLNLAGNGLGSHGGNVVAKYLCSCYLLQHLNIAYNEIGAEAMNLIFVTLKKPVKLESLKVYGNKFNEKSAKIMRRLLDSGVVRQDAIDITVTFDETVCQYRIIPYL